MQGTMLAWSPACLRHEQGQGTDKENADNGKGIDNDEATNALSAPDDMSSE